MKTQNGFTLIEVLITIAIFSVGILALTAMQISGMNSNQYARTLATASTIASNKVDRFMYLDSEHTDLTAGVEHQDASGTHNESQIEYTVKWFVTDDTPVSGAKKIDITIEWNYNGKPRTYETTYIKGN